MAYNPLTGINTPDPVVLGGTPFGQSGGNIGPIAGKKVVDITTDPIVNPSNRSDSSYIAEGRSGTSNTGKNYINGKLATAQEWETFLYGDKKLSERDYKIIYETYYKI
jgi:hypothetical protein